MSRLHVPLDDRATAALHAAMQLTVGDEPDVTRRALVAYAELARLGEHKGRYDVVLEVGGRPLYVSACRTPAEPRRSPW